MKKILIPTILAATILIAASFALMPVQKATTTHLPSVTGANIAADSITAAQIATNAVGTAEIADNTIDDIDVVDDGLDGTSIGDALTADSLTSETANTALTLVASGTGVVTINDLFLIGSNGDTGASLQFAQTGTITQGALTANTEACVDSGITWAGLATTDVVIITPAAAFNAETVVVRPSVTSATAISICFISSGIPDPPNIAWNILVLEL